MDDFLSGLGLHIRVIIAGLMGGAIKTLVGRQGRQLRQVQPWEIISSSIVGAGTANYLGPFLSDRVGTPQELTGFFIGLAGMAACLKIIKAVLTGKLPFKVSKND